MFVRERNVQSDRLDWIDAIALYPRAGSCGARKLPVSAPIGQLRDLAGQNDCFRNLFHGLAAVHSKFLNAPERLALR